MKSLAALLIHPAAAPEKSERTHGPKHADSFAQALHASLGDSRRESRSGLGLAAPAEASPAIEETRSPVSHGAKHGPAENEPADPAPAARLRAKPTAQAAPNAISPERAGQDKPARDDHAAKQPRANRGYSVSAPISEPQPTQTRRTETTRNERPTPARATTDARPSGPPSTRTPADGESTRPTSSNKPRKFAALEHAPVQPSPATSSSTKVDTSATSGRSKPEQPAHASKPGPADSRPDDQVRPQASTMAGQDGPSARPTKNHGILTVQDGQLVPTHDPPAHMARQEQAAESGPPPLGEQALDEPPTDPAERSAPRETTRPLEPPAVQNECPTVDKAPLKRGRPIDHHAVAQSSPPDAVAAQAPAQPLLRQTHPSHHGAVLASQSASQSPIEPARHARDKAALADERPTANSNPPLDEPMLAQPTVVGQEAATPDVQPHRPAQPSQSVPPEMSVPAVTRPPTTLPSARMHEPEVMLPKAVKGSAPPHEASPAAASPFRAPEAKHVRTTVPAAPVHPQVNAATLSEDSAPAVEPSLAAPFPGSSHTTEPEATIPQAIPDDTGRITLSPTDMAEDPEPPQTKMTTPGEDGAPEVVAASPAVPFAPAQPESKREAVVHGPAIQPRVDSTLREPHVISRPVVVRDPRADEHPVVAPAPVGPAEPPASHGEVSTVAAPPEHPKVNRDRSTTRPNADARALPSHSSANPGPQPPPAAAQPRTAVLRERPRAQESSQPVTAESGATPDRPFNGSATNPVTRASQDQSAQPAAAKVVGTTAVESRPEHATDQPDEDRPTFPAATAHEPPASAQLAEPSLPESTALPHSPLDSSPAVPAQPTPMANESEQVKAVPGKPTPIAVETAQVKPTQVKPTLPVVSQPNGSAQPAPSAEPPRRESALPPTLATPPAVPDGMSPPKADAPPATALPNAPQSEPQPAVHARSNDHPSSLPKPGQGPHASNQADPHSASRHPHGEKSVKPVEPSAPAPEPHVDEQPEPTSAKTEDEAIPDQVSPSPLAPSKAEVAPSATPMPPPPTPPVTVALPVQTERRAPDADVLAAANAATVPIQAGLSATTLPSTPEQATPGSPKVEEAHAPRARRSSQDDPPSTPVASLPAPTHAQPGQARPPVAQPQPIGDNQSAPLNQVANQTSHQTAPAPAIPNDRPADPPPIPAPGLPIDLSAVAAASASPAVMHAAQVEGRHARLSNRMSSADAPRGVDDGLSMTVMPHAAHMAIESSEGDLALHLRVRHGSADVTVAGSMAPLFESRAPEARAALASEGLNLGRFDLGQQSGGGGQQGQPAPERAERASEPSTPYRQQSSNNESAPGDGRIHVTA